MSDAPSSMPWETIAQALNDALSQPDDQRDAWLAALCQRDAALGDAVQQMLARIEVIAVSSTLLGTEPAPSGLSPAPHIDALVQRWLDEQAALPAPRDDEPQPGERLGAWALVSKIGEGGMGQVWLARRVDGLYEAQAAIKLLRSDMSRARLAARFARERQLLGRLNHPGIAKMLDAGIESGPAGQDGQAYLVLEYVQGSTLIDHVKGSGLGVVQRVQLLVAVARAVEYAHAQLVVHRDIKPSNVMVTTEGQPKLLDFGIAGLLDEEDDGLLTRQSGRGLTVGYAAPEQISGATVGVGADVFSLGVMLYEVLCGQRPFGSKGDDRARLEHAVLHAEPVRLATRTVEPAWQAPDFAKVRGDLEAVVRKTLRKRPEDRYTSVGALIDDLQHWLNHRPVAARRERWLHRSRLWWRRNRLVASLGLSVPVFLSAGLVVSTWQWQRAERAAHQSAQVTTYLADLLASAKPDERGGASPNVMQLLDKSRSDIESRFTDDPQTKLRLLLVLTDTYRSLNRHDLSIPLAEQGLVLAKASFGGDDPRTVNAQLQLGRQYAVFGPWDKSLQGLEPIRTKVPAQFGAMSEENMQLLSTMGTAYVKLGRWAEAEAAYEQAGQVVQALYPPGHFNRAMHERQIASMYADRGRYGEALARLKLTEPFQRNPPPEHRSDALNLRLVTLMIKQRVGTDDPIEQQADELLGDVTNLMGPRNSMVSILHAAMARWHIERGEFDKGLKHREAVMSDGAPTSVGFRTAKVPERSSRLVARCLAQAAPTAALRDEAHALANDAVAANAQLGNVRADVWFGIGRVGLMLGDLTLTQQAVQRLRSDAGLQSVLTDQQAKGSHLNQIEGDLARAKGDLQRSQDLLARRVAFLNTSPDKATAAKWAAMIDLAYTQVLMHDAKAPATLDAAMASRPAGMPTGHPFDAMAHWLRAVYTTGSEDAPAAQQVRVAVDAAYSGALAQAVPRRLGGMFNN
jgi:serine/threonine-protein kinase